MMGVGSQGGYLRSSAVSRLHGMLGALMAREGLRASPRAVTQLPGPPHFFF